MKYLLLMTVILMTCACAQKQTIPDTVLPPVVVQPEPTPVVTPEPTPAPVVVTAPKLSWEGSVLDVGSKGTRVKALQKAVGVTADGKFGEKTADAVGNFQKRHGLRYTQKGDDATLLKAGVTVYDRAQWSAFVYALVKDGVFDDLMQATDKTRLCAKFNTLTKEQQAHVLSEFIVQIVKHESAYEPTSRMYETTMGYYSEGLLQLSYPDMSWAKYCKFNKSADAKYAEDDERRTILDPYINLDCGIRILAAQTKKNKKFFFKQSQYWAVILEGGKYQKISDITSKTNAIAFCK